MNDEQIKRLLRQAQLAVWARNFKMALFGWGALLGSASLLVGVGLWVSALFFGALMVLPALQISRTAAFNWREFNRAPALLLWREVNNSNTLIASPSPQTTELANSIETLY